jgi:hypothetical protein
VATPAGLAVETVPPDEPAVTAELIAFLKDASLHRDPTGPLRRFNQGRAAGCVDAEVIVSAELRPALRVGFFAQPGTYPAVIRFANASSATDRDKDVRGMSIAIAPVPGENLTPGSGRQDIVLNSHPVMVAPDPKEFLALLRANEAGGVKRALYFLAHPALARIAFAARQHPTSHLDITYWSTTPYLFGPGRAVKYIARPCPGRRSELPAELTDTYLHDAMRAHLAEAEACFDLMVQFQTDPGQMPIEDATVEWKPEASPYVAVARIRIPPQPIDDPAKVAACERMAFNPWNCLAAHRPLGGMNRTRRAIYHALSELRASRS